MKDNTTTYRVTIDIKTTSSRKSLLEWIPATIWDNLEPENGEELVNLYVDEWRG